MTSDEQSIEPWMDIRPEQAIAMGIPEASTVELRLPPCGYAKSVESSRVTPLAKAEADRT